MVGQDALEASPLSFREVGQVGQDEVLGILPGVRKVFQESLCGFGGTPVDGGAPGCRLRPPRFGPGLAGGRPENLKHSGNGRKTGILHCGFEPAETEYPPARNCALEDSGKELEKCGWIGTPPS
jgi:hypothetical protein